MYVYVYTRSIVYIVLQSPTTQYTKMHDQKRVYTHIYAHAHMHTHNTQHTTHNTQHRAHNTYGVATISSLLKMIGLFCRISSLL